MLLVARGLDPVGTGRQLEVTADGLAAAGHPVAFAVTSAGGSLAGRLAARGVAVHRLGVRPASDPAATLRLLRLVRRLGPAAIVGFGRTQAARVALAARLVPRCRAAVWLGLPPTAALQAWPLRRLDAVLAASPHVAAACRRTGVAEGRIAVVPPAAAADPGRGLSRAGIAAALGLDPACEWTLAVAPLEPAARLPRLLWAIDQLGVVRKDLQHVVVGGGPLAAALRRQARTQEIAERLFLVPHCDLLPELLGQVRLVWQSGDVALGGALGDAAARGLPTVAVESDAARQFILDGVTGRIVPQLPESELPRRAFGILEDEPLARRYGAAAAERMAREFPAERFTAGLLAAVSPPGR